MRCKVNDIVLVVACHWKDSIPENLGRTGKIVARESSLEHRFGGVWWEVKPAVTLCGWTSWGGIVDDAGEVFLPDDELLPINPGDLVEDLLTEREKETV